MDFMGQLHRQPQLSYLHLRMNRHVCQLDSPERVLIGSLTTSARGMFLEFPIRVSRLHATAA